jgi:hypothetical protein
MASEVTHSDTIPRLATITLGYSLGQDRVRLDGADDAGKTLTFWLTARLLSQLVPHLIERQADMQFSAQNSDSAITEETDSSDDEANVQCLPGSPEILVASIDVTRKENQILLLFKDSEDVQRAVFVMQYATLQQWNAGLKQCFEQAGWSQSVFQPQTPSDATSHGAITIH